jgi:hypothetical protein
LVSRIIGVRSRRLDIGPRFGDLIWPIAMVEPRDDFALGCRLRLDLRDLW